MRLDPREQMYLEDWTQDGSFIGNDGRSVRCYDDVVLSRPISVDAPMGNFQGDAPVGTVGTVLFYSKGPVGVAQIELYIADHPMVIGYEELSKLKLYMTNEEKYAR
ncbi:hypothetical protein ACFPIF_00995 [Brevundimonas faecalis]|uniref:hypothetical protein n=1 Tax=Brevundimonas faecalis TaxID=947378 RepID=UPI00361F0DDF